MRKTKEITIDDRGTAKTFRITEMPATKFEWWIIQAGRALLGAGLGKELPGVNINSAEDVQEKVGNLLLIFREHIADGIDGSLMLPYNLRKILFQ